MARRILLLCIVTLAGCNGPRADPSSIVEQIEQGRFDEALRLTTAAVKSGRLPAEALAHDPRFVGLKEHPSTRTAVRELVQDHASETDVRVTTKSEPGQRLTLRIRVVDERNAKPRADARVSLVQVDAGGYYFPMDEGGEWNPRLFATGRATAEGAVVFRTIRPAHYGPGYDAEDEPAHVHFEILAEGYRPYGGEIFFEDDPRLTEEHREAGTPIAGIRRGDDGTWKAEVTIGVQPQPPG